MKPDVIDRDLQESRSFFFEHLFLNLLKKKKSLSPSESVGLFITRAIKSQVPAAAKADVLNGQSECLL